MLGVDTARQAYLKQTTQKVNMTDRTGRASFAVLYKADIYNSCVNTFMGCYRWCVPTQRDPVLIYFCEELLPDFCD